MKTDSSMTGDRNRWMTPSADGGTDGQPQTHAYPGARFIRGEFRPLEPLDGPLLSEALDAG